MAKSPLYIKIASELSIQIKNNLYSETNVLPPEIELTKFFSVSRVTIRKAIDLLVKDGILERKHGSGTFIKTTSQVSYNLFKLKSFKEEMELMGCEYSNEVIEFKIINANKEVSNMLKIEENEKVYFIKRLKSMEQEPAVLEVSYMPLKLFNDLTYSDMEQSKYSYVEKKKGYKIKGTFVIVEAVIPDIITKKLLKLPDNLPILETKGITYLENNTPFDYVELYFNPKKYKFTINSDR